MQTKDPETTLARIASDQLGVFSRAQALAAGFTRHQVQHRLRHGRWVILLPSIYQLPSAVRSREQELWAAWLWGGDATFVSHRSAATVWGYEDVPTVRPELWVPRGFARRTKGVTIRRTTGIAAQDRRFVRGLTVTSPERTLLDLAGVLNDEALEIAFESARRNRLVTLDSVARCLQRNAAHGRSGVAALRTLLGHLTDMPSESGLEVKTARLLRASSLPRPVQQYEVDAFGKRYRIDFAWPEYLVALECDGRQRHSQDRDFQHDRTKLTALAAVGWRVLLVTRDDIVHRPHDVLARVEGALTASASLLVRPRGRRSTS